MSADLPIGSVVAWCGTSNNIPAGWLYCDGTILSQNTYSTLFNIIGHSFGNPPPSPEYDANTSFFLPDFRGYFLRGVDGGTGRDPDSASRVDMQNAGQNAGGLPGSVQTDQFRAHSHSYDQFPNGRGDIASGNYWSNGQGQTAETGGNETRPLNAYVYYIIKCE